jgi:MFS family permease
LPLVATRRLGLSAGGYGMLLGALGVGAIAGALVMPRLRRAFSDNQLLLVASCTYAGAMAVAAAVRNPVAVAVALVPAGTAWVGVLAHTNAEVQMFLPRWVRARGLGTYQIVFFGGQALGAFAWGVLADHVGLEPTLLAAAAATAVGAATVRIWPLIDTSHLDREPVAYWPDPRMSIDPGPGDGPVVIVVTYVVDPANEDAFLAVMEGVRRSRRRTGATQWGIHRNGEHPSRLVEIYTVPTWEEHMRQHSGRLTGADEDVERRAQAFCEAPPQVFHLLPAEPSRT